MRQSSDFGFENSDQKDRLDLVNYLLSPTMINVRPTQLSKSFQKGLGSYI